MEPLPKINLRKLIPKKAARLLRSPVVKVLLCFKAHPPAGKSQVVRQYQERRLKLPAPFGQERRHLQKCMIFQVCRFESTLSKFTSNYSHLSAESGGQTAQCSSNRSVDQEYRSIRSRSKSVVMQQTQTTTVKAAQSCSVRTLL